MKTKIRKERLYLCAPNVTVSTVVTIEGSVSNEMLAAAINEAANQNQILSASIVVEEDGSAFYVTRENAENGNQICKKQFPITVTDQCWQEVVQEQVKKRFEIENGELIRFFILKREKNRQLLIMNHHLAGDALSIAYLIENIMTCVSGKKTPFQSICLMDTEQIKSGLPWMTRLMVGGLNRNWKKEEKVFRFSDCRRIFEKYWSRHSVKVLSQEINGDTLKKLQSYSRQNGITLNSLLMTAFSKALASQTNMGISADARAEGNRSMGNYAIGITSSFAYNEAISFSENAINCHKHIYSRLENNKKKFFLMQFMNAVSGTLTDAVYFAFLDNFESKPANMALGMFGYTDNPQGMGVSNLTRVPIATDYDSCRLTDYICVPPLVSNQKRIIGIATIADKMNITMCVMDNEQLAEETAYFARVIEVLKECT